MRIGIDVSQVAHQQTGVANLVIQLVNHLLAIDTTNEYVLFYSSLRRPFPKGAFSESRQLKIRRYFFPPVILDLLWNRLHIMPIEMLIGKVDVFITSDWTEPPSKKAKKVTILYDLIVYRYPEETHDQTKFSLKHLNLASNIVRTQKKRLEWVKKESDKIICISEATQKDAMELLHIPKSRLTVIYPGFTL